MKKTIQCIFFICLVFYALVCVAAGENKSEGLFPKAQLRVLNQQMNKLLSYEALVKRVNEQLDDGQVLSLNTLNRLRVRLSNIIDHTNDMLIRYKKNNEEIKKVIASFSEIKKEKVEETNADDKKYDQYYQQKVTLFKQQKSYFENRIFQIQLMQYDIKRLKKQINERQYLIKNGSILKARNPLYQPNTWVLATQGIVSYISTLVKQIPVALNEYAVSVKQSSFWLGVFLNVVLLALAIFIVKRFHVCRYQLLPVKALLTVIYRGVFPVFFVFLSRQTYLKYFIQSAPDRVSGLVVALLKSLVFVFVFQAVQSCLSYLVGNEKVLKYFEKKWTSLSLLKYLLVLVFFVNNASLFDFKYNAYPFLTAASVSLISWITAIAISVAIIRINFQLKHSK